MVRCQGKNLHGDTYEVEGYHDPPRVRTDDIHLATTLKPPGGRKTGDSGER